jgi:hypothetical protein
MHVYAEFLFLFLLFPTRHWKRATYLRFQFKVRRPSSWYVPLSDCCRVAAIAVIDEMLIMRNRINELVAVTQHCMQSGRDTHMQRQDKIRDIKAAIALRPSVPLQTLNHTETEKRDQGEKGIYPTKKGAHKQPTYSPSSEAQRLLTTNTKQETTCTIINLIHHDQHTSQVSVRIKHTNKKRHAMQVTKHHHLTLISSYPNPPAIFLNQLPLFPLAPAPFSAATRPSHVLTGGGSAYAPAA